MNMEIKGYGTTINNILISSNYSLNIKFSSEMDFMTKNLN